MTMKHPDNKQQQYLDKINELLGAREAKRDSLKALDNMLMQGFALLATMPSRWYVRNAGQKGFEKVVKYINKKHGNKIHAPYNKGNGFGELHGQFAFIPDDVNYSWEITQEEFNFILSKIKHL